MTGTGFADCLAHRWAWSRWMFATLASLVGCDGSDSEREVSWPALVERANERGIDYRHDHGGSGKRFFVETMCGGVALLDVEGDGDLDALLLGEEALPGTGRTVESSVLVRQQDGGSFLRDAEFDGALGYTMGAAVGDVDDDGDPDVFVSCFGPDRLLRNDSGRLTVDPGTDHGLGDPGWATSATFFDADRDGSLDLYVARYVE